MNEEEELELFGISKEEKIELMKREIGNDQITTSPEIIKDIINPRRESINPSLNKELKVSNITKEQLYNDVDEMTDLSFQCKRIGAKHFSEFLIDRRDTILSGSSSVNGFERKAEITHIGIQKIPEEKRGFGFNIFGRKRGEREYAE